MDITTLVKTATIITTGCSVAMVGIAAYSAKQQAELNRAIAAGTQKIAEDLAFMNAPRRAAMRSGK